MNSRPTRRRGIALALLGATALASIAQAGIDVERQFALANPGFEHGLAGWSEWSSDGQAHFAASAGPVGGRRSARCTLPPGAQASLALELPVRSASSPASDVVSFAAEGEKVEFGAWVWLGNDCASGEVYLRVTANVGLASPILAESGRLQAAADPHGSWIYLHTEPVGGTDARIPPGASSFTVALHAAAPGTVWLDDVQGGEFEHAEFGLEDPSFEDPSSLASHWAAQGSVSSSTPGAEAGAYFGKRFAKLSGAGFASIGQSLAVGDGRAAPAPLQTVEACAWVQLENDAQLGAQPDPRAWVRLRVLARTPGTPLDGATLIASAQWNPTFADKRTWSFLHTQLSAAQIPFDKTELVVELAKSVPGTVRVDFVQAGERFSVDGNPRRQVACNYLGWYRSPLFPGATTSPSSSNAIWRNWCWTAPPACDPGHFQLVHNPDCAVSAQCFRVNARRNGATSTEAGLDQLPVAGTYDSRDPALLRYHVELARAIGIDSFVYDHHGHALAMQLAANGEEPINEQAFEALLDAADDADSDLKIAVMYEPKVHFLGWVQNEPTLADKLQGIENDLAHLLGAYSRRRCVQKHDGGLVVYVFRNNICNPAGTQCLNDARWQAIEDHVEQATGLSLCLVADAAPGLAPGSSPFRGMSRWDLLSLELLRYQTFGDFANRQASWPPPTAGGLASFAAELAAQNTKWAAGDDRSRFSVAMVWPGFDDSGVAGWSSNNLLGKDGQPLCVRIADDLGGAFHAVTWSAALDSRSDWIQIATWNDWNEGTQIEPSWDLGFSQSALGSTPPTPAMLDRVFHRAFETQAAIAVFKGLVLGQDLLPARLEAITADYLRSTAFTPGVTRYD